MNVVCIINRSTFIGSSIVFKGTVIYSGICITFHIYCTSVIITTVHEYDIFQYDINSSNIEYPICIFTTDIVAVTFNGHCFVYYHTTRIIATIYTWSILEVVRQFQCSIFRCSINSALQVSVCMIYIRIIISINMNSGTAWFNYIFIGVTCNDIILITDGYSIITGIMETYD